MNEREIRLERLAGLVQAPSLREMALRPAGPRRGVTGLVDSTSHPCAAPSSGSWEPNGAGRRPLLKILACRILRPRGPRWSRGHSVGQRDVRCARHRIRDRPTSARSYLLAAVGRENLIFFAHGAGLYCLRPRRRRAACAGSWPTGSSWRLRSDSFHGYLPV